MADQVGRWLLPVVVVVAVYFSLRKRAAFLPGVELANLEQPPWLYARGDEPIWQHGRSFSGDDFGPTSIAPVPLYAIGFGAGGPLVSVGV